MQQDVRLCQEIMSMRDYAALYEAEETTPKALKSEHRKFMHQLEVRAGVREERARAAKS